MNKFNKKYEQYLRENYLTKSSGQMEKEIGIDRHTIIRWERKLGLPTSRELHDFHKYDDYIIKNYKKRTAKSLAEEIGCSGGYVSKIWRENGLKGKGTFQYYCNEDYFSQIDTPRKAYWLGFIAADGCIYKRDNHQGLLAISIKENDIELLNQFKQDIEATHPINKAKQMISINITSDKIYNDLNNLGLIKQKTWKMDMTILFQNIGKKYFPDFLKGYFDGDGSIHLKNDKINKAYLSIAIPERNGLILSDILQNIYGIKMKFQKDNRQERYLQPFGSLRTTNASNKYCFSKLLYINEDFGLTRKKEKIYSLINLIEENKTNRSENLIAVIKWGELLENLK